MLNREVMKPLGVAGLVLFTTTLGCVCMEGGGKGEEREDGIGGGEVPFSIAWRFL